MYNQNKKRRKKYPTRTGRLTDDPRYFGVAKRKQQHRAGSPKNIAKLRREKRMQLLMAGSITKQPTLSGPQIAFVRKTATKSTLPSMRRVRNWALGWKKK